MDTEKEIKTMKLCKFSYAQIPTLSQTKIRNILSSSTFFAQESTMPTLLLRESLKLQFCYLEAHCVTRVIAQKSPKDTQ